MNEYNSTRLGILADDLSGALDGGAALRRRGIRTFVGWSDDALGALPDDAAFVWNTESRNLPIGEACQNVRFACKALRGHDFPLSYKKIDSTMRGHVGAETVTAMDVLDIRQAVVCPALPAQKRTVKNGALLVDRKPLTESEFARDPLFPLTSAVVFELLRESDLIRSAFMQDPAAIGSDSEQMLWSADAESEADLEKIAQFCLGTGRLPVGSAGLLAHLAKDRVPSAKLPEMRPGNGRIALISASPSLRSQAQIRAAQDRAALIRADLTKLFDETKKEAEIGRLCKDARNALASGDVLVDLTGPDKAHIAASDPEKVKAQSNAILAAVKALSPVLCASSTLILFGGDTTRAALKGLHCTLLEIEKEVQPQIPVSRLVGGDADGLRVITKAGGFGTEQLLCGLLCDESLRR